MAFDVRYCNPDLSTGSNDGSSEANAFQSVSEAETYIETNGPGVHVVMVKFVYDHLLTE